MPATDTNTKFVSYDKKRTVGSGPGIIGARPLTACSRAIFFDGTKASCQGIKAISEKKTSKQKKPWF